MAGDPIDLGGWHLAFAMSYGDVNQQIASRIAALRTTSPNSYPAVLTLTGQTVGSSPQPIRISGDLDPWQLIEGGRQQAIRIGIVIENVTASIGASNYVGTISIAIDADLVTQPNTNIITVQPIVRTGGSAYQFDYSGLDQAPSSVDRTYLNSILGEWLKALDLFGSELMSIDPAVTLPGDWGWMAPQQSQAIVSEVGANPDDHEFIIVSMTGAAPPPSAVTLSGSLIPTGSRMGFAMAPAQFLDNVLKKGMPLTFLKAPSDSFTVVDKKLTANSDIDVPQFKLDDKHTVAATFSGAEFSIEGERIVFRSHVAFPYDSVNVDVDLALDFSLSLARKTVTINGQDVPDFPLIQPDAGNCTFGDIRAEANETFALLQWLVPFLTNVLIGVVAGGIEVARRVQRAQQVQAGPGNQAVQLNQVGGGAVPAGNPQQQAAAAQQAQNNAAGGNPVVMWGNLPRATALFIAGVAATFVAGNIIALLPVWIVLADQDKADQLVKGSMDEAISQVLQAYKLPDAAGVDMKTTSVGINNSLLIGADPIP
jgi:hypothetical protein